MLICPVCSLPLSLGEKNASCENGHNFDRAREGYWNLLLSSSGKGHGDDKGMLLARRAFLESGHYEHLLSALRETLFDLFPPGGVLVDAGCGEGYYTEEVARFLSDGGKKPSLFAFDISKDAARLTAKKMGHKGCAFVGSSYRMPIRSFSADVIMSLFAPFSGEEFLRVLKPGGYLIRVVPMPEHLYSLKRAVYQNPVKNVKEAPVPEGLLLVDHKRIRKDLLLRSGEEIRSLFAMTPYAHKTSREDMAKLDCLSVLTVETDFGLLVYRKGIGGT